jgi:uncharacterized protein (DUF885 family)
MRRVLPLLLVALVVLPLAARAQQPADPAKELHALFAEEWERRLQRNPTFASTQGDRRWNDRWPETTLRSFEEEQKHRQEVLFRLRRFDRTRLSPADRLNFDLFEDQYRRAVDSYPFGEHLLVLTQRGGIQTADELASSLRFETVKDYEDWLARLRGFPAHMDRTVALMREGIRRKIVQPKVVMQRVPAQIDRQIVAKPEDSGFYRPFRRFPASVPEAERERLSAAAQELIRAAIVPTYQRFKEFFTGEYLPACFDQVGAWQLPRGDEYYASEARNYTTTALTPEQIHQLGLREVRRIRAEMEKVREKAGFQGDLDAFFAHLRTDPRFYYKSGDELMEGYRALSKRIDPLLVKVFKTLPRTPYGVEPIPANIAPDTTTAYYQPPAADGSRAGLYYVNLYKPEARPKWEMVALSLHEAVPGHHLQIALAQEQGEVPTFRRFGRYTAFIEGWGLYAESLGEEMGLYEDPYAKFGQLTYEMWRAVRLVVDTGIHYKRWDRQKAIDYFKQNAPKSELDIVNEVDRYIAWPGQALAYKIGEMKIKELRARAAASLGERFDLREFHDVVLRSGALPLDVLERNVEEWARSAGRRDRGTGR